MKDLAFATTSILISAFGFHAIACLVILVWVVSKVEA